MSYEFNFQKMDALTDYVGLLDDLFDEEEFDYPAEIKGMRKLDYMPDMDDYEYQQSRY